MSDTKYPKDLWTRRNPDESRALYADWADRYDDDMATGGYATPGRIAQALTGRMPFDAPVLDFGCGTGISGMALAAEGFSLIDGTDISAEMLEHAQDKPAYRRLWVSDPGTLATEPGEYRAIIATGVISLGAAPPETLDLLLSRLAPGGLLAFSHNEATFADPEYIARVDAALTERRAQELLRENGPHLADKGMESTVFVLEKL